MLLLNLIYEDKLKRVNKENDSSKTVPILFKYLQVIFYK